MPTTSRAARSVPCPAHNVSAGVPCPGGASCPARLRAYGVTLNRGGRKPTGAPATAALPVRVPVPVLERYREAPAGVQRRARVQAAAAFVAAVDEGKEKP